MLLKLILILLNTTKWQMAKLLLVIFGFWRQQDCALITKFQLQDMAVSEERCESNSKIFVLG